MEKVPYVDKTELVYTLFCLFVWFFFYKNLSFKNVEAEIDPDFKNVLRTYPS